jgi:hypothetical protein
LQQRHPSRDLPQGKIAHCQVVLNLYLGSAATEFLKASVDRRVSPVRNAASPR